MSVTGVLLLPTSCAAINICCSWCTSAICFLRPNLAPKIETSLSYQCDGSMSNILKRDSISSLLPFPFISRGKQSKKKPTLTLGIPPPPIPLNGIKFISLFNTIMLILMYSHVLYYITSCIMLLKTTALHTLSSPPVSTCSRQTQVEKEEAQVRL